MPNEFIHEITEMSLFVNEKHKFRQKFTKITLSFIKSEFIFMFKSL